MQPADMEIARLFGDPTVNLLDVTPKSRPEGVYRQLSDVKRGAARRPGVVGKACVMGLRPETIAFTDPGSPGAIPVTVEAETPLNEKTVTLVNTRAAVKSCYRGPPGRQVRNRARPISPSMRMRLPVRQGDRRLIRSAATPMTRRRSGMSGAALFIKGVDKFYGPIDHGVHAVKKLNDGRRRGARSSRFSARPAAARPRHCAWSPVSRKCRAARFRSPGREVHTFAPVKRKVAMAFEGYSLYPPLTVRENIAFALKAAKLSQSVVDEKVASIAKLLEIEDIIGRYPSSISGGQQQRASLGRALIRDADLHLLDEPMGQLEPQLRAVLRGRIKHFIKENGLTAILVTHDQTEANALADRIAVMEGGVLQQFDTPQMIKERPANLFTGTFVGEPPMNVFEATVTGTGDTASPSASTKASSSTTRHRRFRLRCVMRC
jgi:ABC-type sugar transport system ATPase subunit